MKCQFSRDGQRFTCRRCGRVVETTADRVVAKCRVPGLGDRLAFLLQLVGITPARITKIQGKPCNCKERQETVNNWGWRWWRRLTAQRSPANPAEDP